MTADRAIHKAALRRKRDRRGINSSVAAVLINVAIRKIPRLHSFRFSATPSISAKMTEHCVLCQECGRRNSVDVFCDKNSPSVYGPSRSGGVHDIATAARFAQPNLTRLLMLAHELYLRVQEDTTLKLTYDSRKTDRP